MEQVALSGGQSGSECVEYSIDESTELLDTKTFDDYYTNELLLLSDTIKQSCFEILFNSHIEC